MKKTLFAVLSFILITVLIFTSVSCAETPAKSTAPLTETEADTEKTNAQTLAELVTDETAEQQTESLTTEETETETSETELITEDSAEETSEKQPDNTAYLLYKNAAEKTSCLTDMRQITQTEQRIKISFPDGRQVSSASSEASDISVSGNKYKGKTYGKVEGDTKEQEFYADGNRIYLKDGDGYTAYDKTAPEVSGMTALLSKESMQMPVLPESVFEGAEVKDNGDGTKTVKARPSDESTGDALKNVSGLQSVFGMLGADNVKYGVQNAEYEFILSKDGYIIRTSANMSVEISMTIAGISVKAVSEAINVTELIDPGQPVTVDMP